MKKPPATRYATGLSAEFLCRLALRLKFYRILAARHKTPYGEIDIIAARGNTVIAIEVKARSSASAALFAISPPQRQRIANALQNFIQQNQKFKNANLRFDAMIVTPHRWPHHIPNAWHDN